MMGNYSFEMSVCSGKEGIFHFIWFIGKFLRNILPKITGIINGMVLKVQNVRSLNMSLQANSFIIHGIVEKIRNFLSFRKLLQFHNLKLHETTTIMICVSIYTLSFFIFGIRTWTIHLF